MGVIRPAISEDRHYSIARRVLVSSRFISEKRTAKVSYLELWSRAVRAARRVGVPTLFAALVVAGASGRANAAAGLEASFFAGRCWLHGNFFIRMECR